MVTLAMFIRSFTGPSSHRTKIKYCSLCETVCNRTDTLTIRKDSNARHEILGTVLDWMLLPSVGFLSLLWSIIPFTHSTQIHTRGDKPPNNPSPNDLNMACLRAMVKMLDRIQLPQVDSSNTGDDTVHVVSRLFNKYSTALLTSIESCQPDLRVRILIERPT